MLVRALAGEQELCRYPHLLRWVEAQGSLQKHYPGERACAPSMGGGVIFLKVIALQGVYLKVPAQPTFGLLLRGADFCCGVKLILFCTLIFTPIPFPQVHKSWHPERCHLNCRLAGADGTGGCWWRCKQGVGQPHGWPHCLPQGSEEPREKVPVSE